MAFLALVDAPLSSEWMKFPELCKQTHLDREAQRRSPGRRLTAADRSRNDRPRHPKRQAPHRSGCAQPCRIDQRRWRARSAVSSAWFPALPGSSPAKTPDKKMAPSRSPTPRGGLAWYRETKTKLRLLLGARRGRHPLGQFNSPIVPEAAEDRPVRAVRL